MTLRALAVVLGALFLGACSSISDLWSDDDEDTLPGERVSILVLERTLEADAALAADPVIVPPPVENTSWPVPWGTPAHVLHHVGAEAPFALVSRRGAGAGDTDDNMILSAPVIAADRVFLLDSASTVVAMSLQSGQRVWSRNVMPDHEDDDASLGGGVAFADGLLFAATAFGDVLALDAADGTVLWRQSLGSAFRAAPATADGRVFATGADNRLFAMDALTGELLWSHEGIAESAGLLGAAVPAVSGELVIAAYSSGELFALRVENGRVAWSDTLVLQGRLGARAVLADVDASPVIADGFVYAVSQSGTLVAVDLRSGLRVWEQEIPSAETPWLAGDYLYLVTVDAELVCVRRNDGRIRWISQMPRYEDPEDREDPILWSGPVLAGNRLVLTGSHGGAAIHAPEDGSLLEEVALGGGGAAVAPVAAGRHSLCPDPRGRTRRLALTVAGGPRESPPPRANGRPAIRWRTAMPQRPSPCRSCGCRLYGALAGCGSRPAATETAASSAAQSCASRPCAMAESRRSRTRLATGIGARAASAASRTSEMSFSPSARRKPAGS